MRVHFSFKKSGIKPFRLVMYTVPKDLVDSKWKDGGTHCPVFLLRCPELNKATFNIERCLAVGGGEK